MAKRICRLVLYIVTALFGGLILAQGRSASVDWKFYGGASLGERSLCFYDAKGVSHIVSDHVQVWTKCLRQKDLDGVDIKKDFGGKVLQEAVTKTRNAYVPPFESLKTLNADQRGIITVYEEIADIDAFQPQASIFYELDCPQRMIRELSVDINSGGKRGFEGKPAEWGAAPPEGNGAALLELLCPAR
ncbi:hypothetical protein WJ63_04665 [Burkholderia pyrrocinia]|nr:hypothetical protein WJ63_04665 [Burkholderia pyrrocinia]